MSNRNRNYAWKPDIPDHRDQYFDAALALASLPAAALPAFVDRIALGTLVEDQGNLGSCTANAATAAIEIVTGSPQLSRLMAYYDGRALEGSVKYDSGCYIRDVIKTLKKSGCCTETLWPYNIKKYKIRPPTEAFTQGATLIPLVGSYQRATTLADVKTALAKGLPVVFGFMVPSYFMTAATAVSGWIRLPTVKDKMVGGHAVIAVGFDDRITADNPTPFIWAKNSWGPAWGIQGYFKLDQAWFSDPRRLVDDMWIVNPP